LMNIKVSVSKWKEKINLKIGLTILSILASSFHFGFALITQKPYFQLAFQRVICYFIKYYQYNYQRIFYAGQINS